MYKSSGGSEDRLAHQVLLWSKGKLLPQSTLYLWALEFGSRCPVKSGAEARGLETPRRWI